MNNRDLLLRLLALGARAHKVGKEEYADPEEDAILQEVSVATIANWLEELGKFHLVGDVRPRFSKGRSRLVFQLSDEGARVYNDQKLLDKRMNQLLSGEHRGIAEKYDVFISYSSQDSAIANELREGMEKEGFMCFMSEKDVPAAADWEDEIRSAIHLSKRVLLLVTPRSNNRQWILLETGAAWALGKELIPALMFVAPEELAEPLRRRQARVIETSEQRNALIHEITSADSVHQVKIDGHWLDRADEDSLFFQQRGKTVVGVYDFDGQEKKVGFYLGRIKGRSIEYEWRWYDGTYQGHGRMALLEDNRTLSGVWWYGNNEAVVNHIGYERIGEKMPRWVTQKDLDEVWALLEKENEGLNCLHDG